MNETWLKLIPWNGTSGLAEITLRKAGRTGRLKIQGGNGAPRRILRKDLYEFLGMSEKQVEGNNE